MKCLVIYFSLTGNTKKIAEAVCSGVKQAAGNCDLKPIREADPEELADYDLIGLGSPVIGWTPFNVELFINRICNADGRHVFSFCTHNTYWDEYFPSILPMLEKQGLKVIGWDHWFGSAYGPLNQPTPYLTDGHPDREDLKAAEEFGKMMVDRTRRIRDGEEGLVPPFPQMPSDDDRAGLPPPPPKEVMKEVYRNAYRSFTYDREKCTFPECTLCVDNCPMGGIDLSVDPPRVARPCMLCQFCDQVCPTGAICYSREEIEARSRMDREAGFEAAAIERCREYEKNGMFKRYVPEDQVGWDTSIYKVYDRHPRFVTGRGRVQGIDPMEWSDTQSEDR